MVTDKTQFTLDVMGRYVCNSFAEAVASGPFDVVIVGGGTFGLTLAQELHFRSGPGGIKPSNFRVLVLEAGPFTFIEHVQDIPNFQIKSPGVITGDGPGVVPSVNSPLPTTLDLLIQNKLDQQPLLEVWGLPWRSAVGFGGLAFTVGGRSLYFGGWSPRYLASEMHTAPVGAITSSTLWPRAIVEDLQARFFAEAEDQTGPATSNTYINGVLHEFYRQQLFTNYSGIPGRIPLAELPDYVDVYIQNGDVRLKDQIAAPPFAGFRDSVKLDAPLAVQIQSRPGFFPFCKFSSVPLAITAARDAAMQSGGNDANKRLMIVPNCHVKRLITRSYTLATGASVEEVIGIDTSNGPLDLTPSIGGNPNRRPTVVLAMGAIESARMALNSVGAIPNAAEIGANLMVHLRKNVPFSAPLPAGTAISDPELSALLARGRVNIGGTPAHFHLQITASAVPPSMAGAQDPFLFQSVPDLDHVRMLAATKPGSVSAVIRAVGEMVPNPANKVTVNPADPDEYGMPRAFVTIQRSAADKQLMTEIDKAIDFVAANVFGNAGVKAANVTPDGLGTTFHESGTLRMGEDPARSVVNPDGQFHYVTNLYAGDAAVLPTCGSANPVMNGVAMRRRLAKRLVPEGDGDIPAPGTPGGPGVFRPVMPASPPAPGTVIDLFDGATLANWRMAGRGTFHVVDGALQSMPSFDLGLLWCVIPMPQNYALDVDFMVRLPATNSGIFIRFTNPELSGMNNPAWSAVSTGFEIQIDNSGAAPAGQPPGLPKHRTGAVYNVNYPGDGFPTAGVPPPTPGDFVTPLDAAIFPAWNHYRIEVRNDVIRVALNGTNTAKYTNPDPNRGRFSPTEPKFIGLQSYSNYSYTAAFRNIRITVL